MGDLTLNFNRAEFACKGNGNCCGGSAPISMELATALQTLRDKAGLPLTINSGFRCVKHNAAVGGAKHSQHLYGTAADVALPQGFSPVQFAALADSLNKFDGLGIYDWGLHVDVRGTKARWDYRSKKWIC